MMVYRAIAAVSADLAAMGVAKGRENRQQGFMYRGIDDVYQVLAGLLPKHGLVILPRVLSRSVTERVAKSGQPLFSVVVEMEYDFVSTQDDSKHTVKMVGEAMDHGDKATNKAMAVAYKYMAFQTFCIPLEGVMLDPDADSHQLRADDEEGVWVTRIQEAKTIEQLAMVWEEIPKVLRARLAEAKDAAKLRLSKPREEA